jgi:hypothetical protein
MSDSSRQRILRNELTADPLTRGYAGMTDAQAAADLNTENRTVDRTSISGNEVLEAVEWAEYYADSSVPQGQRCNAEQRAALNGFFGMESINILNPNVRQMVNRAATNTSTTRTNLQALQQTTVSRGVELGIGTVKPGEVERARA